ncbi:hypothetical protein MASR2M15_25990 [Anaerolineales bacterium]
MRNLLKSDPILISILLATLGLALLYMLATPIHEATDELWHLGMVERLADTGGLLPLQDPDLDTLWAQEGSQPPLYYALSAQLLRFFHDRDSAAYRVANPHVLAGVPGAYGNKNLVMHDLPASVSASYSQAVLLIRLFSIACGLVTIWAVYAITLTLSPRRPNLARFAAGLSAFNPMWLFISASVNNDNLVFMLNSLCLLLLLKMIKKGFDWKYSLGIALLLTLASLSKISGLVLVPIVIIAAFYILWRDRQWRGFLYLGIAMAVLWFSGAGWWYLRNLLLYGELFGTGTMAAVAGERLLPLDLAGLLAEFEGFRISYWGLFGAVNIQWIMPYYWLMDAFSLLALAGLALFLFGRLHTRDNWLSYLSLIGVILLGSGALIAWTAITYASQGRLLFPFVGAISPLLALGFVELMNRLGRPFALWIPRLWLALMALIALALPIILIAPAYAIAGPISRIPASAQPVFADYGDIRLLAYETPLQRYAVGDTVPVTLYWEVEHPTEQDNSLYLNLVNPNGDAVGKVDSYPANGRRRSSLWPAGLYASTYQIPIVSSSQAAYPLRLQVGWWFYPSERILTPTDADGQALESVLLEMGVVVDSPLLAQQSHLNGLSPDPKPRFDGRIQLESYVLGPLEGQSQPLTLEWQALAGAQHDLRVFVQVLDAAGQLVGQGDAPPTISTHYWRSGDRFLSHHLIQYSEPLPAGSYQLVIGWYHPEDFARLGLSGDYPDAAYPLTSIEQP